MKRKHMKSRATSFVLSLCLTATSAGAMVPAPDAYAANVPGTEAESAVQETGNKDGTAEKASRNAEADAAFAALETEMKANVPEGMEWLSYTNNYQSMEEETFTYKSGAGTATVNNGLTMDVTSITNNSFLATWDKSPYLKSGIVTARFKYASSGERIAFVVKSNDDFDGVAIKYDVTNGSGADATWVIQEIGGAYNTFTGPVLEQNQEYELKIGFHDNKMLIALDGEVIYEGTPDAMGGETVQKRGQIGLHKWWNADASFMISDVSFAGIGTKEAPSNVVEYKNDYEDESYTPNWSGNSAASIETTDTGNRVLKIASGKGRVMDLDSPDIKEGTLALRYKAVAPSGGTPQQFGFRFGATNSKWRELNWDGGQWVVENESSYPSIDMPKPVSGTWNDLVINFTEGSMTVYLNKEEMGTFELGVLKDGAAGKFGIRTWGATYVLIDDVTYTNQIIQPQEIVRYENDFQDGIPGTWSGVEAAIAREGNNKVLCLENLSGMAELADSVDLAQGTYAVKVKTSDAGLGFGMGTGTVKYEGGKWVLTAGGNACEFTGEASSLKLRSWNDVKLSLTEETAVLSINGKESTAVLPAEMSITAGKLGISGTGPIYLDDLIYTEQFLDMGTVMIDKIYYEEYFDTLTDLNWKDLDNQNMSEGYLSGVVAQGKTAVNQDAAIPENGVFQIKMQSDKKLVAFQIGNLTISNDAQDQWKIATSSAEHEFGNTMAVTANEDFVLRAEIIKNTLTLKINNKTIGSAPIPGGFDKTAGGFGVVNTGTASCGVKIDAMGVEEIQTYVENFDGSYEPNWTSNTGISDNNRVVHDAQAGSLTVHVPGVTRFQNHDAPQMKDLHATFDFTPSVDDSMSGGRYGFVFRDTDYTDGLSVEVDINGNWRVNVNDSTKAFDKTFSMAAGETYAVSLDIVGTTVKLKFTGKHTGTVTDMGSVTMGSMPDHAGYFGIKSWYGSKSLTFDNLELTEEPSLPLLNMDVKEEVIKKGDLSAAIDADFPRIISYQLNGKTMRGQEDQVQTIVLNGEKTTPAVTGVKVNESTYKYTMDFADKQVTMEALLEVTDTNVVEFSITDIEEKGDFLVRTVSLGENNWAYADDKMQDATYAWMKSNGQWHGVSEELCDNMSDMEKGGAEGTTMAVVSGNGLAASIENNVMSGGNKVILEKTKKSLVKKAQIRNGEWTYRHTENPAEETEDLPWAKIVITEDQNEDQKTDWQDGAVAHRKEIMTKVYGEEDMANNMMYIAFNFASQANDPFLNTLETGKVLHNFTDGFGQMILHKGYQAEGHDDDIPSYSNIGVRQGGLKDFKYLLEEGDKYNLHVGVHLNATEYHLDANELYYNNLSGATANGYLSDRLLGGWDWIDTAYYVDQKKDVLTGQLQKRFADLDRITRNKETGVGLDFYYIDVYTGNDYNAYKLVEYINDLGIKVGTEFSGPIEPGVTFTHWGTDLGYPNKGNKSTLSRMIKNDLDIFVGNALFKGQKIPVVATWGDSKTDVQQGVTVFYNEVLPTKYMQHFGVLKTETDKITFEENVTSERNKESGMIELRKDGKLISSWKDTGTTTDEGERHAGEANSLIPWTWDMSTGEEVGLNDGAKLYHWNTTGNTTTWELTDEFKNVAAFDMYETTQQGKKKVATINNENGSLTISQAKKNTSYVLYPADSKNLIEAAGNWGEGSPAKDFAFNAEAFAGEEGGVWAKTGDASIEVTPGRENYSIDKETSVNRWERYAQFKTQGGTLTQTLTGLEPGQDYTVGVWTQTSNGRKSGIDVTIDGKTYSNYVTGKDGTHRSSFKYVGTTWQRMAVEFHVPQGVTTAELKLTAAAGSGTVNYDDVKVWKHTTVEEDVNNSGYVLFEDFENTYEGWGPFEYGGGSRKNHIASDRSNENDNNEIVKPGEDKMGPVMTWVLAGENSLKLAETEAGRYVVTNESSLKLQPNTTYTMNFDYTLESGAEYVVYVKPVSSSDGSSKLAFTNHDNAKEVKLNHTANTGDKKTKDTFTGTFTTGDAEDYQVYLYEKTILKEKLPTSGYALILDNFAVKTKAATKEEAQAAYDRAKALKEADYTAASWMVLKEALDEAKTVLENPNATSADYGNVMEQLNLAIRQLVKRYENLEKAIQKAEQIKAEGYTANSYQKLQTALNAAKNAEPENSDVAAELAKAILDAIDGLVSETEAKQAVEAAKKVAQDDYTEESWNIFQNAIGTVENLIANDQELTQEKLDAAVVRLKEAQKNLVKKASQEVMKKLQEIYSSYNGKDASYTLSSFKAMKSILPAIENALSSSSVTESEANALLAQAEEAVKGLVVKGDLTKLKALYEQAKRMDFGPYTEASVKAVKDLFAQTDAVIANADADQKMVDAIYGKLDAAIKALVKKQEENQDKEVVSVAVSPAKATLGVKEKLKLKVSVKPVDAKAGKITFKSSNPKVAVVNAKGQVTAKKKGNAVITVTTANGTKAKCTIKVRKAPSKVTLKAKKKTLKVKKTLQLKASLPKGSAGKITYTSSNKKVATVSAKGKVKALKKGKVTITAKTYNGKKDRIKLTIK